MRDTSVIYFQNQALEWGPRILVALLIIVATWLVARFVKSLLQRSAAKVPALQRQSKGKPAETVGTQLGTIASLIIWLVGIMAALQFLGIGQILQPINDLTAGIFEFLPRLIGAGLILFVGFIVARIVRELVETLIGAAPLENLTGKLGMKGSGETLTAAAATGQPAGAAKASIANAAGIVIFALIIIPVAIAALEVLGIQAISEPAIGMLNQILAAIPRILSAALWLGIAFLAGKLLKSVIEGVLPATGFDSAVRSIGVPTKVAPSRIIGNLVLVVLLLVAGIEAARQLGGETIAGFLAEITELGGRVLFGSLIVLAGVFLARVVGGMFQSSGDGFAQTLVRYGIIALSVAIGLRFMGLANEIVILAFGLILGSAALATGLAFGLGGRKPAERVLDSYATKALAENIAPPPPAPAGTTQPPQSGI